MCMIYPLSSLYALDKGTVAIIMSSSIEPYQRATNGLKTYFADSGASVAVMEYSLEGGKEQQVCAEVEKTKPGVIVVLGTKAAKLAKHNFSELPIVFCMVIDTKQIMASNVTGVSMDIPERQKLDVMRKLLPEARKVGMFYSRDSQQRHEELLRVCQEKGFRLTAREIGVEYDIPAAISEMSGQIDCFIMIPDSKVFFPKSIEHLLLEGLRNRFAIIGLSSLYTKAGTLASLECDYTSLGKQAGELAGRILDGADPAYLPIAEPVKTKLSLNVLVAKRLNISLSPELLKEAGEIFGEGE